MKLNKIKENKKNPRKINKEKLEKLKKSIKNFSKMLELRPIIIDENNIILGGNMRLKALKELGYKEIPDKWVKKENELSKEEKNEFIIKDNIGYGDWDFNDLNLNWDINLLDDWGLEIDNDDNGDNGDNDDNYNDNRINLFDKIILEVSLDNEEELKKLYNELVERNFICKILSI